MRRIGYIRTSTNDQLVDRQIDQLKGACDRYFVESGVSATRRSHRPIYEKVMGMLQRGDALVVCSLDRAFRSALDALAELEEMEDRGIQLVCLVQTYDTTTPDGKFFFTLTAALGTWERDTLSYRTKQGLASARRRGKTLGRPRKLTDEQIAEARRLVEMEFYSSLTQVAEAFRVHERTLQRALEGK